MLFTPALITDPYLSETHKIVRAFTVPPTNARKRLIDTTVRALKTAGSWAVMDVLWMIWAADTGAGHVNWKNPGTFGLAAVNSPTFAADQGYTGNGSNAHLTTGWNPSTNGVNYVLDSAHLGVWVRTGAAAENTTDAGVNANLRIDSRRVGDLFLGRANNVNNITAANTDAAYFAINRSASNAVQVRKNNASLTTSAEASTAISNANLFILSLAAGASFSSKQVSAVHAGGSLSATQLDDTYAALDAYRSGL